MSGPEVAGTSTPERQAIHTSANGSCTPCGISSRTLAWIVWARGAVWYFGVAIVVALGGGWVGRETAQHQSAPRNFSGMVALGEGKYLVVHDTKGDAADPRISLLETSPEHAPQWRKVVVDWDGNQRSSDLESICSVPGTADEFLLCESSYWQGRYGRVFHARFDKRRDSLTVLHALALPHLGDDIEGFVCTKDAAGKLLLIAGERGGKQGSPGVLHWGWLDLNRGELRLVGSKPIAAPAFAWANAKKRRDCSDLYLDAQQQLWCVATEDAGDGGPFRSVIYRVATVDPNSTDPLQLIEKPTAAWICEGIKAEALGAPLAGDLGLCIGTDDENYPGMFRTLLPL